jgi:hypothetical protein
VKSQDRLDTGPSFSSLTVEISTPLPSVPGPSKVFLFTLFFTFVI